MTGSERRRGVVGRGRDDRCGGAATLTPSTRVAPRMPAAAKVGVSQKKSLDPLVTPVNYVL